MRYATVFSMLSMRNTPMRALMAVGLVLLSLPFAPDTALAVTSSNAAPIVLPRPGPPPGCPNRCPSEQAAPFPSAIVVSGQSGTVTDVNVSLRNLTYEFNGPPDADILLVAPDGKAVMLMSDACGDDANFNPITSPTTLNFDDQAPSALPADAPCSGGTFRPVDDDDDGEFAFHEPDEIPGGPAAPATTVALSTFNGIAPNGSWKLYVVDDYPNDADTQGRAGQIGGGWSIDIATNTGGAAAATAGPTATTAPRQSRTATTAGPNNAPMPNTGSSTGPLMATAAALLVVGWVMVKKARPKKLFPRPVRR